MTTSQHHTMKIRGVKLFIILVSSYFSMDQIHLKQSYKVHPFKDHISAEHGALKIIYTAFIWPFFHFLGQCSQFIFNSFQNEIKSTCFIFPFAY